MSNSMVGGDVLLGNRMHRELGSKIKRQLKLIQQHVCVRLKRAPKYSPVVFFLLLVKRTCNQICLM